MLRVLLLWAMKLGLLSRHFEHISGFAFTTHVRSRSLSAGRARSAAGAGDHGSSSRTWGLPNHRQRISYSMFNARRRRTSTNRAANAGRGITSSFSMAQETLILTEENVIAVLEEAKQELGTLFGNRAENNEVGITGDVEFVCLDGPSIIVRLTGRFWHAKADVLARVANFVLTRIPECIDVEIEDDSQLEDADPTGRGEAFDM